MGDLMNKSVAIKEQNSTVSMWGAFHLVKAGIPTGNLVILPRPEVRRNNGQMVKLIRYRPSSSLCCAPTTDAGVESESVYTEARKAPKTWSFWRNIFRVRESIGSLPVRFRRKSRALSQKPWWR